jgi:hypothetical protein
MTWIELVKEYFPNATEAECDYILWEQTAFPVCGLNEVKRQLQALKDSGY